MFSIFHSYCGQLKDFGIDWFGPAVIHDDEAGAVSVPDTIIPLQPHEMAVLHTLYSPLQVFVKLCEHARYCMYVYTLCFE